AFTATATASGLTSDMSQPFLVNIDRTAPTVTLTVPGSTNSFTPPARVVVTDNAGGGGIPATGTVTLDVDLNNDGDFADPGELGSTSAIATNGVAVFNVVPALSTGTVKMQARFTDLAGNMGTSAVQTVTIGAASGWTIGDATVSTDPLNGNAQALMG